MLKRSVLEIKDSYMMISINLIWVICGKLLYRLITAKNQWRELKTRTQKPSSRYSHSFVSHQDHLFVFGGVSSGQPLNDLWDFNISISFPKWEVLDDFQERKNGAKYLPVGCSPLLDGDIQRSVCMHDMRSD